MKRKKRCNETNKMKYLKGARGITLIALVITIIVLLILAAVSIATLTGENEILTQAQNAKERTEEAQGEEENRLSEYENKINQYVNEETIVDGVTIPDGFYYVGGTKNSGLVISDVEGDDLDNTKQGNQFVWGPVDTYSEFIRREGYSNGNLQSMLSNCGEANSTGTNSQVTETATTQAEAQAMYASVERNGGFYIGRYESGKDTNENVVVKKGANVYNVIPWSANGEMQETNGTTGGAVELSRNFDTANHYTSVTSTLIYGVQWDAVMKWMENISNLNVEGKTYIQDSTGMGWYAGNSGYQIHQTGIDVDSKKSNCVNNIYDLGGNVYEWTMESFSSTDRVYRGGTAYRWRYTYASFFSYKHLSGGSQQ